MNSIYSFIMEGFGSQGKKNSSNTTTAVSNHDIINENNVGIGAENVQHPRNESVNRPPSNRVPLADATHGTFQQQNIINPASADAGSNDDADEGFADGKPPTAAAQGNAKNPAGVDADSYDCPLSVHSDYSSSSRSGSVVTPGSENNMNPPDDDDDRTSNNENINLLQNQNVIPSSQPNSRPSSQDHTAEAQQWPKDHPRDPRRDPNLADLKFRFRVPNAAFLRSNVLSPAHYLRGLPWKVYIMPKQLEQFRQSRTSWQPQPVVISDKTPVATLGLFLQCNADDTTLSWSCHGEAKIRLINENNEIALERSVVHNFYHKENDWGFSTFIEYGKTEWNSAVHARDGALLVEIECTADPPHGTNWNSKRLTGYVGLKNQGATCYMNSLLQALYFTNYLRRAVYLISTELEDPSKSIPFQLQRLFFDLQVSSKPASTKRLTQAFGWDSIDSLVQHDVEEFCRMLLDNLEDKLKGTAMEGAINQLFEGRTISYIQCKNVNYTSSRVETFMDVALNVKGLPNVQDSFREYCTTDELIGDNQYDAGVHGKQDAIKGIKFVQFPPVLHLHLKRFTYDIQTGDFVKINEKFEFPQHLDLSEHLDTALYMNELQQHQQQQLDEAEAAKFGDDPEAAAAAVAAAAAAFDEATSGPTASPINSNSKSIAELVMHQPPPLYSLHAIFVHSGDHHGGHYVCYINPNCDGTSWYKFDDDVVSKCHARQAIEGNYGGTNDTSSRSCSNAYMLVYVRDFDQSRVLCPVVQRKDLNPMFFIRLNRQTVLDQRLEQAEQRNEPQCTLKLLLDSDLRPAGMQPGMFDLPLLQPSLQVRININDTWREAHYKLARALGVPFTTLRIWPLVKEVPESGPGYGQTGVVRWRPQFIFGQMGTTTAASGRHDGDDTTDGGGGSVENYPNAPPPQNNANDDKDAWLYIERKLAVDLQITKPPRMQQQHMYAQQQQQQLVFCHTNNDDFLCWLQQSQPPPDGGGGTLQPLPPTSHSTHVLVFVKYYDPKYSLLHLERPLLVKFHENNVLTAFYSDLYSQLARIIPGGSRSANDLWIWFDSRQRDIIALNKVPTQISPNSLIRQAEMELRNGHALNLNETAASKDFSRIIAADGEAVIVQRALTSENPSDSSASLAHRFKFPTAPLYVYEQLNMIRLTLQEREGGVGSQASLVNSSGSGSSAAAAAAAAVQAAGATVSSATSSNTSLSGGGVNSSATNTMQRMSPPVAGAGAGARTHWPELVFEISQLTTLTELQKLVAARLEIDDYRKVMFSKFVGGQNAGQTAGGKNSMSAFGSNSSTSLGGNSNNSRESQPITKLGTVNIADVVGNVPYQSAASYQKRKKMMLYTILPMPIEDFDSKREVEIYYLPDVRDAVDNSGPGGVERTLFINQSARVSDLLENVRQQFQVPPDTPLRLVEVVNSTIRSPPVRDSVDINASLFENAAKSKQFRVEPVPPDQRALSAAPNFYIVPSSTSPPSSQQQVVPPAASSGRSTSTPVADRAEILMPVAHFHKEVHAVFGTPFLVRVVDGDTYGAVKQRIRNMLGTQEKEMEKWKFCVIYMGKRSDMQSNGRDPVDEAEMVDRPMPVTDLIKFRAQSGSNTWSSLWLGLDHVNNTQGGKLGGLPGSFSSAGGGGQMKKVRGAAEKTLKIHN